jgi:hypothetical protein
LLDQLDGVVAVDIGRHRMGAESGQRGREDEQKLFHYLLFFRRRNCPFALRGGVRFFFVMLFSPLRLR